MSGHVLIVTKDASVGAPVAEELERRGYEISWCPGPSAPDYVCIGGKGHGCPLTSDADVVVVHGWLAPDEFRKGTPSWHMCLYYRDRGLPVVYLIGPDAPPWPQPLENVIELPRRSHPRAVGDAVDAVLMGGVSVLHLRRRERSA